MYFNFRNSSEDYYSSPQHLSASQYAENASPAVSANYNGPSGQYEGTSNAPSYAPAPYHPHNVAPEHHFYPQSSPIKKEPPQFNNMIHHASNGPSAENVVAGSVDITTMLRQIKAEVKGQDIVDGTFLDRS